MLLSDVSIRRPVFTAMLSVCLVVLGVMGLKELGTDLYPDVSLPVVVVNTVYRGAGPGEVETQVIDPLEDAVAGISGVNKIHSWSRENVGTVMVQFTMSTDLDQAVQEVRDKVAGAVALLPPEVEAPVVSRVDVGASPVMTWAVRADLDSQSLRRALEDRMRPALAQLDGVAEIRLTGGDVREIQVDIDLDKARAANLAPIQIAERLGMENLNVPAGRLALGPTEMSVRAMGQFQDVEELRNLPVARSPSGAPVRLREVANVRDGVAERRTTARLNGADAIILEVVKQPGSNTIAVADGVRARVEELSSSIAPGFAATLLVDQSDLIRENAKEVWIALIFGGLMAVLIILMFLLDPRGTFISALALPTSVIGTFFVMFVLGYTLNQVSLLALALAIGLLIDDAVVVREAITYRLERGEDPFSAASKGTSDVGLAVLATTLSLVAVFIPVAFMPGIVGQFLRQFGVTISVAVLISLFISFTLDPMLSSRLVKRRRPGEHAVENALARSLRQSFEWTERLYERVLRWVLAHKWLTAGLTVVVLALSFGASSKLGAEFMPAEDRSQFFVDFTLPDSASLEETEKRVGEAEALLRTLPEVRDMYTVVGLNGDVSKARMRVLTTAKDARDKSIPDLKEEARRALDGKLPATRVNLSDPPIIEGVGGDYFPIMARVTGPDLEVVKQQATRIADILRDIEGTSDVRVEVNPPRPELQIQVDRLRAGDAGLTAAGLGGQLRLAIDGQVVGKLREGTEETDIRVRLQPEDRASPEKLRALHVLTPTGLRPVSDLAHVSLEDGPAVIEHENRERQIAVFSQLAKGAALGTVAGTLKERVAQMGLPAGYSVVFDGQMKEFADQNKAFLFAFGLAFVFIYMVLASQFESLKHPLTIMVSLPLALVGALLSLLASGHLLSMGAMIGVILLLGLVTKNAILLVDGALQNLRAGDDVDTALLKAGPRRLRPILMTSAAMAIGMVPTAIGKGLGSEFRAPMAISVIGGVITSTFLTLLVVPVVFAAFEKLRFGRGARPGQMDTDPLADAPQKDAA